MNNDISPLWTPEELSALSHADVRVDNAAYGVKTDSRQVWSGDLFIALKGLETDGHAFVAQAFKAGAVAAIVSRTPAGMADHDPRLVRVPDTRKALCQLATIARNRTDAHVIGVTGSAGKTSVVHALSTALAQTGRTHHSVKSYNNHVGVPLSLARMPRQTAYGVFEIGMSGPRQITPLAEMVQPQTAIVTTVSSAHRGNFDDESAIAKAKAEIFDGLVSGGVAVIGTDHYFACALEDKARRVGADVRTVSCRNRAYSFTRVVKMRHDCTCVTADIGGTIITYRVGQPGTAWLLNSLLALTAAQAAGADMGLAALALANIRPEPGRGRLYNVPLEGGKAVILDDAYNANPASMEAALERLRILPCAKEQRKLAILGDMAELGDQAETLHCDLAEALVASGVHKVFAVGPLMERAAVHAGIPVTRFETVNDVKLHMKKILRPGDALLIKGANDAGLSGLAEALSAYAHSRLPSFAEEPVNKVAE